MVTLNQPTPETLPKIQNAGARRVLVVEDEAEIRGLIVLHLRRNGFMVDECEDGEKARELLTQRDYDLAIFDWMLPGLSGLELTRWTRSQSRMDFLPILFVTAKTEAEHIATGLDAGADDYLGKPFDTLVLMARVHALLRRKEWLNGRSEQSSEPAAQLSLGDLVLKPNLYEVTLAGSPVDLTRSEFRLLESLLLNQGKVCSRESLIEQIQGEGVNVVGRTVDTHVFGLRKKLGPYADSIETVRGVGYRVRYLTATE